MVLVSHQPDRQPDRKQLTFSKRSLRLRWGLLGLLIAPTLLVILHWLGYEVKLWGCPLKALVGIPCPTWGMTRSMLAIADGHWSAVARYHLLAPLAIAIWGLGLLQVSLELFTQRPWSHWWQQRGLWLSGLILIFGYHSFRLYHLWNSGMLAIQMQESLLGQLL
ncbi:MAG: DUF2752 domain-containing protein [Cyanobacteria bacterium P01_A01_bin.114]